MLRAFDDQVDTLGAYPARDKISALTMLAGDFQDDTRMIQACVALLEAKLLKTSPQCKLPIIYLIDSIMKAHPSHYVEAFRDRIVPMLYAALPTLSVPDREKVRKVLNTWDEFGFYLKETKQIRMRIEQLQLQPGGFRPPRGVPRPRGPPLADAGTKRVAPHGAPIQGVHKRPRSTLNQLHSVPPTSGGGASYDAPVFGSQTDEDVLLYGEPNVPGMISGPPRNIHPVVHSGSYGMPRPAVRFPTHGSVAQPLDPMNMYQEGYNYPPPANTGFNARHANLTNGNSSFMQGPPSVTQFDHLPPVRLTHSILENISNHPSVHQLSDYGEITRVLAKHEPMLAREIAAGLARRRRELSSDPAEADSALQEPPLQLHPIAQHILSLIEQHRLQSEALTHQNGPAIDPSLGNMPLNVSYPGSTQPMPSLGGSQIDSVQATAAASGGPPPTDTSLSAQMLKRRDDAAVAALYEKGLPFRCLSDGLRFKTRDELAKHQAWLLSMSERRANNKGVLSQPWLPDAETWAKLKPRQLEIETKSFFEIEDEKRREQEETGASSFDSESEYEVSADESQKVCPISGEEFKKRWDNEKRKWVYKGAVKIDGVIYNAQAVRGMSMDSNEGEYSDADSTFEASPTSPNSGDTHPSDRRSPVIEQYPKDESPPTVVATHTLDEPTAITTVSSVTTDAMTQSNTVSNTEPVHSVNHSQEMGDTETYSNAENKTSTCASQISDTNTVTHATTCTTSITQKSTVNTHELPEHLIDNHHTETLNDGEKSPGRESIASDVSGTL